MGAHVRLVRLALLLGCLATGGCSAPVRPGPATVPASPETPLVSRQVAPTTAAHGSRDWRLARPARDHQVEGYATSSSGLPGAPVALRVSTTARSFDVRADRIGAYDGGDGRLVWGSSRLPGHVQARPTFADRERRTVVARWRTDAVVPTTGWAPGLYVFKLRASSGWQAQVPYVVTSPSARDRVALVFPVTTWQAYNDRGGYSLYTAPAGDRRSWAVSFDRPYPAPGATEMGFGAVPVVVAAERLGIPLAYFTNIDVAMRPDALSGARAHVSSGHDEYWSREMRDHVERARATGTNLVFLGANTLYWRVRLEGAGRVVVGYRSDAALDPAAPSARTGQWRQGVEPDPENGLTGTQYECFPVDALFRVASPGWWGFAGTGTHRGEELDHLVGVEADRVYPVQGTPRPLQVLAHAPYSCRSVATSAQAVYYTTASGAGVLNVGTLRWTCALVDRCPVPVTRRTVRFVNRVTATVLRDFARGPAALRHPAHDNVEEFDLPTENLVPAS